MFYICKQRPFVVVNLQALSLYVSTKQVELSFAHIFAHCAKWIIHILSHCLKWIISTSLLRTNLGLFNSVIISTEHLSIHKLTWQSGDGIDGFSVCKAVDSGFFGLLLYWAHYLHFFFLKSRNERMCAAILRQSESMNERDICFKSANTI